MPLVNALPLHPTASWSRTIPDGADSLITTWDLEELGALNAPPVADIAWARRGTRTKEGVGIVKVAHSMPQTLAFRPFDGKRTLRRVGLVTKDVRPTPEDLSFGFPMIWDSIGNGYKLVAESDDGALLDVLGVDGVGLQGLPGQYVTAGAAHEAQIVADLFFTSMYCAAHGITTPSKFTYPQPGNPTGIALFSDGTGADGTAGALHHANPAFAGGGRFKNVHAAYGSFKTKFGASLSVMATKPHATLPNMQSGAVVTDVFGPPSMREKFWENMVQNLTMEWVSSAGARNGTSSVVGAAATSNPYSALAAQGITEENFLGAAFGPRRYWIVPQLAFHPYMVANPTKEMWINVSAGPGRASWANKACNNRLFVPTFRFYGPGDPKAEEERMSRFIGDLDAACEPGAPGEIDVFFEV